MANGADPTELDQARAQLLAAQAERIIAQTNSIKAQAENGDTAPLEAGALFFVGFMAFGVLIGLTVGASHAEGVSTSLVTGLFTFVAGVVLGGAGAVKLGAKRLSPNTAGVALACLSIATISGLFGGLAVRRALVKTDRQRARVEWFENQLLSRHLGLTRLPAGEPTDEKKKKKKNDAGTVAHGPPPLGLSASGLQAAPDTICKEYTTKLGSSSYPTNDQSIYDDYEAVVDAVCTGFKGGGELLCNQHRALLGKYKQAQTDHRVRALMAEFLVSVCPK